MAIPNFGQMKELYQLQKKAKQLQKELKELEIEARSSDNLVGVVVSGEMKIITLEIANELLHPDKKNELVSKLKDTIGQAMSRAQAESASRMQPLLKDIKLPGM
jgi:DNA-binding YbaB/EbfC family protein